MKYSRNFQYLLNSQETHACWKLPHTISSLSCSLHSSNDFQLRGYCRDFVYNLKYCLWDAWSRQYNAQQEVTYSDPTDNDIHRCLVCIKWKVLCFVYEYYCHSVIRLGPYCNHTVRGNEYWKHGKLISQPNNQPRSQALPPETRLLNNYD